MDHESQQPHSHQKGRGLSEAQWVNNLYGIYFEYLRKLHWVRHHHWKLSRRSFSVHLRKVHRLQKVSAQKINKLFKTVRVVQVQDGGDQCRRGQHDKILGHQIQWNYLHQHRRRATIPKTNERPSQNIIGSPAEYRRIPLLHAEGWEGLQQYP